MHSGRDENCASIIRENIVGREREEFFQTFRYISHSSSEVGVLDPYKKKIQRRRNYNERTDETVPIFFGDLTDVVESIIINLCKFILNQTKNDPEFFSPSTKWLWHDAEWPARIVRSLHSRSRRHPSSFTSRALSVESVL